MILPLITWTEEFAIGHESLDAEHHSLVDCINEIHTAQCAKQSSGQMKPLVNTLYRLAGDHFQHENSILNGINSGPIPYGVDKRAFLGAMVDAAIAEHTANHKRSLHELNTTIRDFYAGLGSVEQELSLGLKEWFIDHTIKYDVPLRRVFQTLAGRVL
jgi:hemerythrin